MRGLASAAQPKVPLSSHAVYLRIGLPFSYTLVRALPHFLGSDFSPLIIIPPCSLISRAIEGLRSRRAAFPGRYSNSMTTLGRAGLGMLAMRCLMSNLS